MKLFRKLDSHLLTALLVGIISLVGFLSTSFLLTGKYLDIPLGFLLSGEIIAIIYISSHVLLNIDKKRGTATFAIVAIAIRFVVMLTALLLAFLLYYKWNIRYFNVFVLIGMYMVAVVTFLLINLLNKGKE